MFKGILIALSLLCAGTASAQDITVQMERMRAGSVITIQAHTGAVYSHHMIGESRPNEFVYETRLGTSASGPLVWVHYADAHGNLTRSVNAQGDPITWTPHRCNRTLGSCSYLEVRADGVQQPYTRVTTPFVGGFSYQVFNSAGIVTLSGQAILNELGWTRWGTSQRRNEARIEVEILSAHYR